MVGFPRTGGGRARDFEEGVGVSRGRRVRGEVRSSRYEEGRGREAEEEVEYGLDSGREGEVGSLRYERGGERSSR